MKFSKLLPLCLILNTSFAYSAQEEKKAYEDKHKYEIKPSQLNKLPKALESEIFLNILDGLQPAFEYTFAKHTNVNSVAISSDNRHVVSGSYDKTAKVWDLQTDTLLHTFNHNNSIRSVAINSDNRYVVTGCFDRTAKIWDLQTGTLLHTFNHNDWVYSVAISSDSRLVVTGSVDRTAKIWDLQTGTLLHNFHHNNGTVDSVVISSDNRFVVTGSSDRTAKVWNLQNGVLLHTFNHDASVYSVAISSDNRYIVTGSYDRTAKIWNLQTGTLLHTFNHNSFYTSVAISSDNRSVVIGNQILKIFILPEEQIKIIKSLSAEQLSLVSDLCQFKKINTQNIYITLNSKQKTIFETLPIFMQKALKENCKILTTTAEIMAYTLWKNRTKIACAATIGISFAWQYLFRK